MGDDDPLPAQARQISRHVGQADGKNIGNILLRQVDSAGSRSVQGEQIQQIADFFKGAVIVLMRGFVDQQVDVHGVSFQNLGI